MTDIKNWLPLLAALLAAGMWLGRLESRVSHLEQQQHYLHGTFDLPKEP